MNVSFNGFNENCATFIAGASVTTGYAVKVSDNGTVANAANGDAFCGICTDVRDGYATVQLTGYVKVPYTGTAPSAGYAALSANGTGGIKADSDGVSYLIIDVDTTAGTAGIIL